MPNNPKPQAPVQKNEVNPRGTAPSTQPQVSKGGKASGFNTAERENAESERQANRLLGELHRPGPRSI